MLANAAPGSIRAAAPTAERICRRLAESGALPPAALTTGPGATGDGTFGLTTRALAEAQSADEATTKRSIFLISCFGGLLKTFVQVPGTFSYAERGRLLPLSPPEPSA